MAIDRQACGAVFHHTIEPLQLVCGGGGLALQGGDARVNRLAGFPSGGAYSFQESVHFQLEAIAFTGQGLRRR